MPEKLSEKPGRVVSPTRTYDLQVIIKDLDYTADLVGLDITSSLSTGYQVVNLVMMVDPNDIIIQDLFGKDPIKLYISLLYEDAALQGKLIPGERTDFELMYLKSDFQLGEKDKFSTPTVKDRSTLIISTVTRKPYQTLSTIVNDVFIGATLRQIIESIVSNTEATIEYDSNGENKSILDQVCIPPTLLYKIIKEYDRHSNNIFDGFLDQRFGLFNGTPGVFCQFDNKIFIKNLTSRLLKDQTFTIYQLASGLDKKTTEKIFSDVRNSNNKVFYTYDLIDTDYSGNARFAVIASNLNHIVKPRDTLYQVLNQDLKSVGNSFSLVHKNPLVNKNLNLPIDPSVNRTRYYNEDTGYETEMTLFNSRFGRSLADMSSISINVERNLPILPLMNVGECVKYKPLILEYQELEGKYILWSSIISFLRSGDWQPTCRLNLIRTNKKH